MHTCWIQFKTTQKDSRKHLEEQKIKKRINSKSTQLETLRNSCTGYTSGAAPVHPKATCYIGALSPVYPDSVAEFGWRKRQYHRLHRWPMTEHRSIHHVILQRACKLGQKLHFSTGALKKMHRCTHPCFDQRLCSGQWRKFFSTGYTGATPKHAPVQYCQTVPVSDVNGYYLILVWPDTPVLPLRSIRWLRLFGQFVPNG